MRRKIVVLILGVFLTTPVLAQFYEDKYEEVVRPIERIVASSEAYYANVQIPGALEDDKSDAERYEETRGPLDEANDRHFKDADYFPALDQSETRL